LICAAHDEAGAIAASVAKRITTDIDVRQFRLQCSETSRHRTFGDVGFDRSRKHLIAGFELAFKARQHVAHDAWNASEHIDVFHAKPRRPAWIVDEPSAFWHHRHAQSRCEHRFGRILAAAADEVGNALVLDKRHFKRLGDAHGGDVVVRGTDAAGREHIIVLGFDFANCWHDDGLIIGNHARFGDANAPAAKRVGNIA